MSSSVPSKAPISGEHADLTQQASGFGEKPPAIPTTFEGMLGAGLMFALFLITFANAVVRYFTNVSFAFTEEYSVALMVVMVLVGSAVSFAHDRQLRMSFLTDRLPDQARWLVELAVLATCAAFFLALAFYAASYVWDEYRFEVMSPGLGIPQWRYTIALPILSLLIALRICGRLLRVAKAQG